MLRAVVDTLLELDEREDFDARAVSAVLEAATLAPQLPVREIDKVDRDKVGGGDVVRLEDVGDEAAVWSRERRGCRSGGRHAHGERRVQEVTHGPRNFI